MNSSTVFISSLGIMVICSTNVTQSPLINKEGVICCWIIRCLLFVHNFHRVIELIQLFVHSVVIVCYGDCYWEVLIMMRRIHCTSPVLTEENQVPEVNVPTQAPLLPFSSSPPLLNPESPIWLGHFSPPLPFASPFSSLLLSFPPLFPFRRRPS